ncbi:MAG: DUF4132 domain-containing protein [Anaerolineaceae bacterium]|nr:DUF4132 domain-containing protein [Anaerolineaceae bacterium]
MSITDPGKVENNQMEFSPNVMEIKNMVENADFQKIDDLVFLKKLVLAIETNLSPSERQSLFMELFQDKAKEIDLTWDFLDRLPLNYSLPFRDPTDGNWRRKLEFMQHCIKQTRYDFYTNRYYLTAVRTASVASGDSAGNETIHEMVVKIQEKNKWSLRDALELSHSSSEEALGVIEKCIFFGAGSSDLPKLICFCSTSNLIKIIKMISELEKVDPYYLKEMFNIGLLSNTDIRYIFKKILHYLEEPGCGLNQIQNYDAEGAYLSLWAAACYDVNNSIPYAINLIRTGDAEKRLKAVQFLVQFHKEETIPVLLDLINDPDKSISESVLMYFYTLFSGGNRYFLFNRGNSSWVFKDESIYDKYNFFEIIESFLSKPDQSVKIHGDSYRFYPEFLIDFLGNRPLGRLLPYLFKMHPQSTYDLAQNLDEEKHSVEDLKQFWISILGKRYMGFEAFDRLKKMPLVDKDIIRMENFFSRDSRDFRKPLIDWFYSLPDEQLIGSINRLVNMKSLKKRLGGLEIIERCKKNNRLLPECDRILNTYRDRPDLSESEKKLIGDESAVDLLQQENVNGVKNLFQLLRGLGNNKFISRPTGTVQSQYSEKIKDCFPVKGDTNDLFKNILKTTSIDEDRLIELAFFSPQWSGYIESALGWNGFAEAIRWFGSPVDHSLSFKEIYMVLGEEKWNRMLDIFSMDPENYSRKVSNILLGRLSFDELVQQYSTRNWGGYWEKKRDHVFLLGVVPLPEFGDREKEMLRRYQILHDFLRGAGNNDYDNSAATGALHNLAKTAGFSSYKNFELAMEIEAVKDLKDGPVQFEIDGYRFSLSLNELAEPVFASEKNGVTIRTVPEKFKEDERIKTFKNRVKEIRKMTTRLRRFLENSMTDRKQFTIQDIKLLFSHPVLKILMQNLVFTSINGMGYPASSGNSLLSISGEVIKLDDNDVLLIAHPCEMVEAGNWHLWQHECFVNGRVQPFKQIFREVYTVTDAERNEDHVSRRFNGIQIKSHSALGLFKVRGWDRDYGDERNVKPQKYYSEYKLTVKTETLLEELFSNYVGTFEDIYFSNDQGKIIPLEEVPPIIFSETMRDIDLVVSVAYAGKSSWESTGSTIENRKALVKETCSLLKLKNVNIVDHFAMIEGKLTNYKVHLGSGSIHQMPGNYVCVVPDKSKVEEKLFLPFVDKDRMSSIILSKIILLSHDDKIKDRVILDQIRKSE